MHNRPATLIALVAGLAAAGCAFVSSPDKEDAIDAASADVAPKALSTAVFAGGCFWCVESDFDKLDGVVETISGYTGGELANPTYEQVSHETTGHYEVVKVTYDSDKVSYDTLVDYFVHHVDPTDAEGQFCDKGPSYRTAIFVANDAERATAEAELAEASDTLGTVVATKILPAETFWPAEDYHQDYYTKNPLKYRYYRSACGRDGRVKELWGSSDH